MLASIVHRPQAGYPMPDEFFSPSCRYPEYRHGHVAGRANDVYAMVRQAFAQAGLDAANFGKPHWNPLGQFIGPGSKVFILCNFVHHRRRTESATDFLGKCTHGSILRALVDYALLAAGDTGRVSFGNSPLQSCDFRRVLEETGAESVVRFFGERRIPVEARDLRLFVTDRTISGRTINVAMRDQTQGVAVDLGKHSLLNEFNPDGANGCAAEFRVADYDPTLMKVWHRGGIHQYVIHKAVLDADVILCAPKLKTHEKVGITCALKGYVGTVGRKECLPHHRFGAPDSGGDEYPKGNLLLSASSGLTDWVHRRQGEQRFNGVVESADHLLRRVLRKMGYVTAGAWHGNDTAWRMSLDIARISHFSDPAGQMHSACVRPNLVVIDAVVAGEGEGPLAPSAVPAGGVVFSDNAVFADWIATQLMGYDARAIPSLREALRPAIWPLLTGSIGSGEVISNGKKIQLANVAPLLGRAFRAPRGWQRHLMPL